MALDLSRFAKAFFEEATEHLSSLEDLLLTVNLVRPDAESLNAIFRAVHSIKGGAAAFGHKSLAEFTHEFESVLDRVRKGTLSLDKPKVDIFLRAGDMMRRHLAAIEAETAPDLQEMRAVLEFVHAAAAAPTPGALDNGSEFDAPDATSLSVATARAPRYAVSLAVRRSEFEADDALDGLRDDLAGLGSIFDLHAESRDESTLMVCFGLDTDVDADELRESLEFLVPGDAIDIVANERRSRRGEAPIPATGKATAPADDDDGSFGFFDSLSAAEPPASATSMLLAEPDVQLAAISDASSIRVNVAKVDQLINLVGELVIAEAMIAQSTNRLDPEARLQLAAAQTQLERNTRDLQDAVLAIRMMPMSFVMSRLPRLVRELAARLGKEVELEMQGEDTELDKSVIEKIADPLTHLVRNALDHGIEPPALREASGKRRAGRLLVRAAHQGGSIVITVTDDGAGLNRARILAKAHDAGLGGADDWSDHDVWQLVFAPGFTTAAEINDVSGRGVGMDVVWQNVHALGGRVDIASKSGEGTTMSIRLPLTLAILDGMSISVSGETYIVPLASIVQSIQPEGNAIKSVGGSRLVMVREEYLPITSLRDVFRLPDAGSASTLLVVLEDDGKRAALEVDELNGQQQVVVKSIEANYRRIKGVSGATILGDGRVAFILDAPYLVSLAHAQSLGRSSTRGTLHAA
jgi:two-component system chemotaxis sensor kinase CheA